MHILLVEDDEAGPSGTGLGLAIGQSIVERHGGIMTVHSAGEGRGSTFTVVLKRASPFAVTTSTASADTHTHGMKELCHSSANDGTQ